MDAPRFAFSQTLIYLSADRDGLPRRDSFTQGHVFNPYFFTEDGVSCACRLCEPVLWQRVPLPLWCDYDLPDGPPSARNGQAWPDLDSELFDRFS